MSNRLTEAEIVRLGFFLEALEEEWGGGTWQEKAEAVAQFIADGCDLSEYEDRVQLRVIEGGSALQELDT